MMRLTCLDLLEVTAGCLRLLSSDLGLRVVTSNQLSDISALAKVRYDLNKGF